MCEGLLRLKHPVTLSNDTRCRNSTLVHAGNHSASIPALQQRCGPRVEQAGASVAGRGLQRDLPFAQGGGKLVAERLQICDAPLQFAEALFGDSVDLPARNTAGIADAQDAAEIGQRKPGLQRTLNDDDALDGSLGKAAVSVGVPGRGRRTAIDSVMTDRVGADFRPFRERTSALSLSAAHFGTIGSPVLCSAIWNLRNACKAVRASVSFVVMISRPPAGIPRHDRPGLATF